MTDIDTCTVTDDSKYSWLHPNPFVRSWKIDASHIDHYQHTNNLAYLARLEQLAWEHSAHIGLRFSDYQTHDRAMVIVKHELNYHLPSHINDSLLCATWINHCDQKYRLSRKFQYINAKTAKTIFTATTHFVCVSLSNGAPKKMPAIFKEVYGNIALSP